MTVLVTGAGNALLHSLLPADFRLIEPMLEHVDLPLRTKLEVLGRPIKNAYFLSDGIASVVADGGRPMEVGVIGREGMTGLPLVLGVQENVVNETYMQVAGHGWRISAADLRKAIALSRPLHGTMLRFVNSFLNQASQTALANGRAKLEQRLARWLLMVHDRIGGNDLPLTHEFIAVMLGVRRSGVTLALQELERRGGVRQKRGVLTLVDRKTLEATASTHYKKL